MPEPNRQLVAIMFTDIVGYTKLMGENEAKALELLKVNREIHKRQLARFDGKLLKEMGDGMLASFSTISDAVFCAAAIQERAKETESLRLRIGIHVGEVVFEKNDVFGDGVNIASRIEALAPPSEIWVSESVYKNLKNKDGVELSFIRDETLKNVDEPVKIFSVQVTDDLLSAPSVEYYNKRHGIRRWLRPAGITLGIMVILLFALNLLDFSPFGNSDSASIEKSIAVLPFDYISENPDNTFYSEGMMLAVLNNLSKVQDLTVITKSSTEQYRETTKTARQIADELDVANLLTGSVQKIGNRISVSVDLTNGRNDQIIWSENYTREIEDIFALQSEIAQDVARQLQTILSAQTVDLLDNRPTQNMESYELYLRGVEIEEKANTIEDIEAATTFYQKAIELDPEFAEPYLHLAGFHRFAFWELNNAPKDVQDSVYSLIDTALKLNPDLPDAYRLKAWFNAFALNDRQEAAALLRKALALDPNDADSYSFMGWLYLNWAPPDYPLALENFLKALELEKGEGRQELLENIGFTYLGAGDFTKAEEYYIKAIEMNPSKANYNRIWWAMFIQGKFNEALNWAYLTLENQPDDNEALNEIARTYLYLEEYEKSAEAYAIWNEDIKGEFDEIDQTSFNIGYALALLKLGRDEEANKILDDRIEHGRKIMEAGVWDGGGGELYEQARIQALRGNHEKAYAYLNEFKQTEFMWGSLYWLQVDPFFESIQDEDEFVEIVDEGMKLKEEVRDKLRLTEQSLDMQRTLSK